MDIQDREIKIRLILELEPSIAVDTTRITALAQSNLHLFPGMRAFALLKALTVTRADIADHP